MKIDELVSQLKVFEDDIIEGVKIALQDYLDFDEIKNLNFGTKSKSQFLKFVTEFNYEKVYGEWDVLSIDVINISFSNSKKELDKEWEDMQSYKLNRQPLEHDSQGGHYLLEMMVPIKAKEKTITKLKELKEWNDS